MKKKIQTLIENKVTFKTFFTKAKIHSNAKLIKGVVCGYRIEEIDDEFEVYKQCRQMEKLIDELAKGRKMEKNIKKMNDLILKILKKNILLFFIICWDYFINIPSRG